MSDGTAFRKGTSVVLAVMTAVLVSGFFAPEAMALITTVTLTAPNGGEIFSGTENIVWSTDGTTGDEVEISYSTDDFTSIIVLVDTVAHDSSPYAWDTTLVPDGTSYKLKVKNVVNSAQDQSSFTFIIDNTVPTIIAPANVTGEATGPFTTVGLGTATATDNLDPAPVITNDAPASFPVGVHTVTWTATDWAGNTSNATQTVTITDTTPPVIAAHLDETHEATSGAGAVVNYTPPNATDLVDGVFSATCLPASGFTFPLGTTTVTCNATDVAGNPAVSTTFGITVEDTTPPVIAPHPDETGNEATSLAGAVVTYTSPATSDAVDGPGTATCVPVSGSTCALGNTTVTCNATDIAGNIASPTTFTIQVVDTTDPVITAHSINHLRQPAH